MMLDLLPLDIGLTVVSTWLASLKDISLLDVAYCNCTRRPDLLFMLNHTSVTVDSVADSESSWHCKEHHATAFLLWLSTRQVKFPSLAMAVMSILPAGRLAGDGGVCLKHVQRLELRGSVDFTLPSQSIGSCLSLFPGLKELDCSGWMDIMGDELQAIAAAPCLLLSLLLDSCKRLSTKCFVSAVSLLQGRLQSLCARDLTDAMLLCLLRCPLLSQLTISCNALSCQAIRQFCCLHGRLVLLDMYYLGGYGGEDPLDGQTVSCIAKANPGLRTLAFPSLAYGPEEFHHACLHAVLSLCAAVECVWCQDYKLMSLPLPSLPEGQGQRCCSLDLPMGSTALSIFSDNQFSRSITSLTAGLDAAQAAEAQALLLKHGKQMTNLTVSGYFDLKNLAHCPNLTALSLSVHLSKTHMRCLLSLSTHCPRLQQLAIHFKGLTDDILLKVLQGYAGKCIQELDLSCCEQVSDDVLWAIADCFPALLALNVSDTAVDGDTIHQLLQEELLPNARIWLSAMQHMEFLQMHSIHEVSSWHRVQSLITYL